MKEHLVSLSGNTIRIIFLFSISWKRYDNDLLGLILELFQSNSSLNDKIIPTKQIYCFLTAARVLSQ
jgi:hypothetical protein